MNYNKKKEKNNITDSGEFIPSYFTWQTLSNQKKRANELNNMTKNKK